MGWVRILKPFERKVLDNFASPSDLSVVSALVSLVPRLCQFTVPICLPRPLCVTHEPWLITEKLVGQIPPGEVSCSCDIRPGPPWQRWHFLQVHKPIPMSQPQPWEMLHRHLALISVVDILGMRTRAISKAVCLYLINVQECTPSFISPAAANQTWRYLSPALKLNYFPPWC